MSTLNNVLEEIDDGNGIPKQAYSMKCACSNVDPEHEEPVMSDAFYVFWEPSNNHLHIQCFDCEQTYCPHQQCVPPPTAQVVGHHD